MVRIGEHQNDVRKQFERLKICEHAWEMELNNNYQITLIIFRKMNNSEEKVILLSQKFGIIS